MHWAECTLATAWTDARPLAPNAEMLLDAMAAEARRSHTTTASTAAAPRDFDIKPSRLNAAVARASPLTTCHGGRKKSNRKKIDRTFSGDSPRTPNPQKHRYIEILGRTSRDTTISICKVVANAPAAAYCVERNILQCPSAEGYIPTVHHHTAAAQKQVAAVFFFLSSVWNPGDTASKQEVIVTYGSVVI